MMRFDLHRISVVTGRCETMTDIHTMRESESPASDWHDAAHEAGER